MLLTIDGIHHEVVACWNTPTPQNCHYKLHRMSDIQYENWHFWNSAFNGEFNIDRQATGPSWGQATEF